MSQPQQIVENIKTGADVVAASVAWAAFMGWVTSAAAILSVIWFVMQIVMNWKKFSNAFCSGIWSVSRIFKWVKDKLPGAKP